MRIQNKLFLSLLTTSIVAVAILVLLMQWSVSRGMVDYVNQREIEKLQPFISALAERYSFDQNWNWLASNPRQLRRLLVENLLLRERQHRDYEHDDDDDHEYEHHRPPRPFKRPDIAIIDQSGDVVASINYHIKQRTKLPISWQDNTVGWVSIPHHKNITQGFELVFIEQQRKAFFIVSLLVILLAAVIAFPLARHFIKPIKQITKGANQLTQGQYDMQLPMKRNDEFGELARDFNQLAITLEKNEGARKRWVADISHELRTPLAILRGEIEAMLDGVRDVSKQGIESMREEVEHLTQLVNDLYELSKADIGDLSYRKTELDFSVLLSNKLTQYQSEFDKNKLQMTINNALKTASIWADETRINQLLDNLLTNVIRYTDKDGQVQVDLTQNEQQLMLQIADSAPGVAEDALSQLFDYLYRTEQSRNRESGGSGLGLAICKRIVEGHGGTINAEHSDLGGVAIIVQLPLN